MTDDFTVKKVKEVPAGYRTFQEPIRATEKAIQLQYYSWTLWIPRRALRQTPDGLFHAPSWAIETSKNHPSSRKDD